MFQIKLPKVFDILLFNESRKVGLGLWLFIIVNFFFYFNRVSVETWQGMILLSSAMVGGGTIADKMLANGKDKPNGQTA